MNNKADYINYKLQKSAQSLKEARLLMENRMNDTAISRLYYAAFYAINALLVSNNFNPKTHSGTKTLFNKEFILTHKMDSRFSDFYSFLMARDLRQIMMILFLWTKIKYNQCLLKRKNLFQRLLK